MKHLFVTALAVAGAGLAARAQLPELRFDVASVKPHAADTADGSSGGMCSGPDTQVTMTRFGAGGASTTTVASPYSPGTCRFRRTTARDLVRAAYRVARLPSGDPIVGGPAWVDSDLFDVDAKAGGARPQAELEQMLQQLLAERFRLRLRRERREVDGFVLTVSPRGPRLELSQSFAGSAVTRVGEITTQGAVLDRLARALEFRLGKPIVNETGLTEVYAFTLRWTPADDERPLMPGLSREDQARLAASVDPHGPSLFTALEEQLGLRLQPRKVPHEFLVIDSIERPTPN